MEFTSITVRECLRIMDKGEVFSFKVVTYDRKRKKGGEIREYAEAKLMRSWGKTGASKKQSGRELTAAEASARLAKAARRNPNHRDWYTRNLRILQNGFESSLIKKIHPPLLIEFNGRKVVF